MPVAAGAVRGAPLPLDIGASMTLLGLIIIVLALVVGAAAFFGLPTAGTQVGWDFFGNHFQLAATTVFFLGAGTMLALLLGLWLLQSGLRRSARKSRELRTLKKEQKHQARLDAEHQRHAAERPVTGTTTTTGTGLGGAHPVDADRDGDTLR